MAQPRIKQKQRRIHKPQSVHITQYRIIVIMSLVVIFGGGMVFAVHRTMQQHVLSDMTRAVEGGPMPQVTGVRSEKALEEIERAHDLVQQRLMQEHQNNLRPVASPSAHVERGANDNRPPKPHPTGDEMNEDNQQASEGGMLHRLTGRPHPENEPVATDGAHTFGLKASTMHGISKFPIKVDPATNTMEVTTPSGNQHVVVLPDAAVQNTVKEKTFTRVDDTASGSAVTLTDKDGQLVYELHGVSDQKLLGLFSVGIKKDVTVSAQTGAVVSSHESFGQSLLDFLAF